MHTIFIDSIPALSTRGSHWWSSTVLIHLLLPSRMPFGLQSAHAVEFVGVGQHEIRRQGIEFLVTNAGLVDRLYDILLVVQEVIHLEGQGRISPCLIQREVPYQFVYIGQTLVSMARCIAHIRSDIP